MTQDYSKHSLTQFLEETSGDQNEADYLIRTHNKYLVLINDEYKAKVLISMKNYKSITIENFVAYIRTKTKIFIKGIEKSVDLFEIDLKDPKSDIIGFHSMRDVLKNFTLNELNISENSIYKIIFSPQLAKFLLENNYSIVDLKKREKTGETIFVFIVDDGFYKTISKWNEIKGNKR